MRSSEIENLGAIGGSAIARFGGVAREVHQSVAGGTFKTLGTIGAPVRLMHDGISTAAYGAVGAGLKAVPRGIGMALGRTAPADGRPMADGPGGALTLAALNGFWGD